MPMVSSIGTFLQAVRTQRTNTTEVLEKLFGTPGNLQALQSHPNFQPGAPDSLQTTHVLDSLPHWVRDELLKGHGPCSELLDGLSLNDEELQHIDDWDDNQKEKLRVALVDAITNAPNTQAFQFRWDLHAGTDEDMQPQTPAPGATVTFRSPQGKLKVKVIPGVALTLHNRDISVDV